MSTHKYEPLEVGQIHLLSFGSETGLGELLFHVNHCTMDQDTDFKPCPTLGATHSLVNVVNEKG